MIIAVIVRSFSKFIFAILLLPAVIPIAKGQTSDTCMDVEDEQARQLYEKAITLPDNDSKTIELLIKAVKLEPEYVAAYYVLADIYYQRALKSGSSGVNIGYVQKDFNKAFKYYEKVISICPAYENYYACYIMGKHYFELGKTELALPLLQKFIGHNPPGSAEVKQASSILNYWQIYQNLISNPVPYNPVSLDGICTGADEYLPLISPDNELIFYTRRYMTVDKRTTIQKEAEEFTFSNRLWNKGDEVYSSGIPMPYPFNTSSNQGGATITALNNHMFFTRCDYIIINETNYNNCDIYKSDYIDGKWTNPQKLGSNINGKDTWESQPSVSADGKTLYFASARPAGVGGIDIYSSELNEHGEWEKARNLGKTINTEGDDKSPFIHSDSKTLYFSSNGRPGLGGFDIFYSKQTGKNEWTEPVNIGYPINTEEDDLGFIVSTDGKKAYFSSNKLNGKGGLDIYSIDLYEAARPQKMMLLKGQLTDYKGHGLTNAVVEVKSVKSDSLSEGIVDKLTGKYAVILPVRPKEEFVMTVRKKQYTFSSQLLVSEEEDGEKPREINVGLSPVEAGVSFQISNILFATNSADFDNASLIILENLKRFLSENPKVRLAIYGHTDNVGDEQSNIILSEKRAGAVLDFLREHGIDNKRLISKGFGELIPIAGNDTEEGRALNRRTEFVILEN